MRSSPAPRGPGLSALVPDQRQEGEKEELCSTTVTKSDEDKRTELAATVPYAEEAHTWLQKNPYVENWASELDEVKAELDRAQQQRQQQIEALNAIHQAQGEQFKAEAEATARALNKVGPCGGERAEHAAAKAAAAWERFQKAPMLIPPPLDLRLVERKQKLMEQYLLQYFTFMTEVPGQPSEQLSGEMQKSLDVWRHVEGAKVLCVVSEQAAPYTHQAQ